MYYIGVDLGGTNIVVGLLNEKYEIIDKKSKETLRERENEEIIKDIAILSIEIIKDNNINKDEVKWIGVGSPGTCDSINGVVIYANNLKFDNVNVRKEIQKYIDLPVYVGNDANCAAYGEFFAGAGKGTKNTSMITLGTGVGGGFIVEGKIIEGSHFNGAEIGHTVISVDGRQCSCGRLGCFEAYSSATALIEIANEMANIKKDSKLNELNKGNEKNTTAKMVFECFDLGDIHMKEVVENYYKYLAEGITNIINTFDPEVIVIGGGISGRGDKLIEPIITKVKERIYGGDLKVKIKIAELGNDAGVVGAGLLGLNK